LTTKQDGRFSFAQLPPGQHRLVRRIETAGWPVGDSGKVWRHQTLCDLDIRPGETTIVVVDGSGESSVSGKTPAQSIP
jgi:hypothetical protein